MQCAGCRDDRAGFDLAHQFRAEGVQRHGLAGHAVPAVGEPTDHQRPPAPRIARRLDAIMEQKHQRVGPVKMLQRRGDRVFVGQVMLRQQVDDHLRVGRRRGDVAPALVVGAQAVGIDQVAVVPHRHLHAPAVLAHERLGIGHAAGAGGRVPIMADATAPLETLEYLGVEDFADQAHADVMLDGSAVGDGDPGRLLSTVLLGVQAHVDQLRAVRRPPDREHTTLMFGFVWHRHAGGWRESRTIATVARPVKAAPRNDAPGEMSMEASSPSHGSGGGLSLCEMQFEVARHVVDDA